MRNNFENTTSNLRALYHQQRASIRKRLKEFSTVAPSKYFYELTYCILTPQTSAQNAEYVVEELKKQNFHNSTLNPEKLLQNKHHYIRFHKTKTKHLIQLKKFYPTIRKQLLNGLPATELREWLVKNISGLGWKEASHFLRNIGYRNFAILDRHILKNLVRFKIIRTIPKTLTRKRYLEIEEMFRGFANRIGISIDELDLLFWWIETGEIRK